MNTLYKVLVWVALVAGIVGWFLPAGIALIAGGTTNYDALDVTDGYYVDASQVIDGSGNWVGSGTFAISGTLTATGDVRVKNPTNTGGLVTLSGNTTSSLSAANICDKTYADFAATTGNASTTLPDPADLISDCMTTQGDVRSLILRNTSSTVASGIYIGTTASTTVKYVTSTAGIILGGSRAKIDFLLVTTTPATSPMLEAYVTIIH